MKRIIVLLVICASQVTSALADFPSHADVCVDAKINGKAVSIVSKASLAKGFINQNPAWSAIYIKASDVPSEARFAPQWRRIFTDPAFCNDDPGCSANSKPTPPGQKPPLDTKAAIKTVGQLRFQFQGFLETIPDGGHFTKPDLTSTDYLLGDDTEHPIYCVVGSDVPMAPKPTVLKLPIRVRASSDDLNIDADRDKDAFKSVKPATVTFTRDGIQKSNSSKLQAAVGYAIPLSVDNQALKSGFFTGEIVPYISANESITKIDGKPASLADTNNAALGVLLSTQFTPRDVDVTHVFSFKPQYLWNTKNSSEIASSRLIYQPWTFWLNRPMQIGEFFGADWLTLVFDLRNDYADYTKKGNDPVAARTYMSYDRAGSKFGVAFSTDPTTAHLVLLVTETMLYGFTGSIRRLDYLDSSLTYYFDSTSNFGLTLSYTKGTNEDTGVNARTYTAGLSVKF